ncbi:MAG: DUF1190 domain-containing protein [Halomonadaceae bacterium]|nr:DUF1190 domain-containing protein [Halomonadaceae bacterium]
MVVLTAVTKVSGGAYSQQRVLAVYASHAECVADRVDQKLCADLELNASYQAEQFIWSFDGHQDCAALYGEAQCLVNDEGRVSLAMSGFTQFGLQSDSPHTALPVFRSDRYRTHHLPNAYPVVMGSNTIMAGLMEQGTFIAGRPRSIGDPLCVNDVCKPVMDHLTSLQLPRPVVSALFAN